MKSEGILPEGLVGGFGIRPGKLKRLRHLNAPIAVCGFKGSGKDTVCKLIKSELEAMGIKSRVVAFADPIKDAVKMAFHLSSDEEYDRFKRGTVTVDAFGTKVSGRHILRTIGMTMRSYDRYQFVRRVNEIVERFPNEIIIISDVRFDNEVINCIDNNWPIIKVVSESAKSDGHISEKEVEDDLCYKIIDNGGTLDELKSKVSEIVKELIEKRRKTE